MTTDTGGEGRPPVTPEEWRAYLTEYNDWYLSGLSEEEHEEFVEYHLDERQAEQRWLGYEPAGEQELAEAEERLGVRLPPSLRGFLRVSNGWGPVSEWTDGLLPCQEIDWFHKMDDTFVNAAEEHEPETEEERAEHREFTAFLRRCLTVAYGEDDFLLDTGRVSADGEYEGYLLAVKYGEFEGPYPSFGALVVAGREEIAGLR
ncbi:SMI1/KNR4 family protein [Streptomyces sp. TRM 70361]|uniref:SMI1/KNR4 family protein n=1 Tax=Streptomyces sp. TRM 70361 TaxID=3116553 RepID=UPI002E7AF517|nr:SMI1/KNR4 family protein [Streptomyces sp. TRM 70361]MEE1940396.1 SMI1/KNR4 family protein [Streptomyces sp. TRM 70361]